MENRKGVIIIGGHVQGLGIARILGKLKIPVVIMDATSLNLARHSKYCSSFVKYNKDNLYQSLLDLGKKGFFKDYIVFPTNDLHVGILSKNKEELSSYFTIASDDWEVVEKCYNKRETYTIAKEIGIPIANTWMPNSLQELERLEINYPVIIKPAVMYSFYEKLKKKVFVCNNKKELIENYQLAIDVIPPKEIIVQAIIEGGSQHLYSACFLRQKSGVIQSFVGRRARQHPPDFGNATTFAQIVQNDELVELSSQFLKHINYQGVCEVEYKYDESSKEYKLLEINPRTWKWHSIAEKANVNLLENYYNLLQNIPLKLGKTIRNANFRHLLTDIPTVLKYKRLGIYSKHVSYPVKYAVWDKDDLKPAFYELLYLPSFILKR